MTVSDEKTGVLLVNLGSPDAPTPAALKKYLKQFLSDEHVIHTDRMPRWLWWLLLHAIILNSRPRKSAQLYQKVWDTFGKGSPLVAISQKLVQTLQAKFHNKNTSIALAMRYGNPSINTAVANLQAQGVTKITVLPLFPQFSHTTTSSVMAEVRKIKNLPAIQFIEHYHDHPAYIEAIKQSILNCWDNKGRAQKLIFSYHGLPQKYVDKGDIYPKHCQQTTHLLAQALNLKDDEYLHCYQSRFGNQRWLQPYLDETLKKLPQKGITNVEIICPGFAADCLETLEEIQHENKNYFLQAGGKKYSYIPALNASNEQLNCLLKVLAEHT